MVPTGVSRKRKRTRAAPSDRSPSRWQRARPPLSTGCPGQQHTPDRGDVNHEPWPRRYSEEEFGYITSQPGEMFAARPGRPREHGRPSRPTCRYLSLLSGQGRSYYRLTAKIRGMADLYSVVSGYGSPHLASRDPLRPCFRGRRRTPPPEVMRMDDSADRFLELIHQLEDFTHSISPDQAHSEFDETTLQLFWMRWPQLSAWSGSLWRLLSEELAGPSAPHDSELFEMGESGWERPPGPYGRRDDAHPGRAHHPGQSHVRGRRRDGAREGGLGPGHAGSLPGRHP